MSISFGTATDSTLEVLYNSPHDIKGFQFSVSGITVSGGFGGAAADAGLSVVAGGGSVVIGYAISQNNIPAGSGLLTTLNVNDYDYSATACLSSPVFADGEGNNINLVELGECASLPCVTDVDSDGLCDDVDDCVDADVDDVCDDVDDCVGNNYDECGVCDGPGSIYECGCFDIADGACNCYGHVEDECGVCNGNGVDADTDGICDDVDDCVGEFDVCDVCNGPGAIYECGCADVAEGECNCYGHVEDDCGVCHGDGTSCLDNTISFGQATTTTLEVYYSSSSDIAAFQFDLGDAIATGASGGAAADAGFTISAGSVGILGVSFSLDELGTIPAGSGLLTVLDIAEYSTATTACLSNLIVSDPDGDALAFNDLDTPADTGSLSLIHI